jgi:hypothetical protein
MRQATLLIARVGRYRLCYTGTHGDFDTMENCLKEADNSLVDRIERAEYIAQRVSIASESCRQASEELKQKVSLHKQNILAEVYSAFQNYETKLDSLT